MKETEWYPGDIKPVHVGVYKRDFEDGNRNIGFCYWDGERWYSNGSSALEATFNFESDYLSPYQNLPWRGLTEIIMDKAKPGHLTNGYPILPTKKGKVLQDASKRRRVLEQIKAPPLNWKAPK